MIDMAKMGGRKQLKRIASPKTLNVLRKGTHGRWIVKSGPGPHPHLKSIPLTILLRDLLGFAKTAREAKIILNSRNVLIDGKVRKDPKFPVGFMDIVSFPAASKYYRIEYDRLGRLVPVEIAKDKTSYKLCKILKKSTIGGGKFQFGFHDGRTFKTDKSDMTLGDVVKLTIPDQKVLGVLPLKVGATAYVTSGKHAGKRGKILEIIPGTITRKPAVSIKSEKETFSTNKEIVFVLEGKEAGK
jgi:small subunit ribosomal protein S4e